MAWPSDLVRTKNWGSEVLTDSDLEGQLDLIINWVMAVMNSTTGHAHDATANDSQKVSAAAGLTIASQATGDILYASSASAFARLAAGTAGQALTSAGAAAPAWAGFTAIGEIEYHNGTTRTKLAAGSAGQFLRSGGAGAPTWAAPAEGELAAAAVDQATLKTTTGEVSHQSDTNTVLTLSGGEYAFLHNTKMGQTNSDNYTNCVFGNLSANFTGFTSYALKGTFKSGGSFTVFAKNRYVTTSGKDHWMFLKVVKTAYTEPQDGGQPPVHRPVGDIISAYSAPDHPCYGSGGDENDIPHPFDGGLDPPHEIIVVDNDVIPEIKSKCTHRRTMLSVVHEEYKCDMAGEGVYTPREIVEFDEYGTKKGQIIKEMKTPESLKLMISAEKISIKRRMVNTMPAGVKCRKLKLK